MEHSEGSKRSRKPYTLTKTRESWSNDEHERFIKALQLYNRDWKKIETYVGTKTVVQIRSHAQKYFQKVMKAGITDAIPPPRPKRRASDPPHGHAAERHTESAKLMRMASDAQPSRQGSGKDEDSDEGLQLHHSSHAAGHAHHAQRHHTQHHSSKQQQQQGSAELQEASAQLEASRSLISCQGLQQVYLFLASLFTQQQSHHDLPGMLQRLSTRDRTVLAALLTSLVEELGHQQQQQPGLHPACQHTAMQDQQQHDDGLVHADELLQQQQQHHVSGNGSGGGTINGTDGAAAAAGYAAEDAAAVGRVDAAAAAADPTAAAATTHVPPSMHHQQQQQQHVQLGMQQAAEQAALQHTYGPAGLTGQQPLVQQLQLQPQMAAAGTAVGGYLQQLQQMQQELEPMAEG